MTTNVCMKGLSQRRERLEEDRCHVRIDRKVLISSSAIRSFSVGNRKNAHPFRKRGATPLGERDFCCKQKREMRHGQDRSHLLARLLGVA